MEGQEFRPIPVATLLGKTVPDFALYLVKPDYAGRYVLYREKGLVLRKEHLSRLRQHGVEHVYIRAEDRLQQQRYMVESARQLLSDEKRSWQDKASAIYEFSKSAVQFALEEPCEENIKTCRELAQEHVRYVVGDPHAIPNLLRIISHDYYTYTHSVNVCSFSVALCRQLGIVELAELKVVGIGSMLHDVGKSRIKQAILNKPGPLTAAEFEQVKKHPELGVAILAETSPMPPQAVEIVLGHHEKCDGSGYPRGLTGKELPLCVRACCIADIFDALTTHRTYRRAWSGFRALRLMQREMAAEVDQDILAEFIRLMGKASQHQAAA